MAKKQILLNAFNMNCVGHINHGLWTHPRDRSTDYRLLPYWTNLARTLERGLFDGLFLADIVGVYDVYQHNVDVTLRESIQLPVNDPTLLVSAMAAVTENLGFGVTVNLTYEQPYLLARRFSTLDHLTQGRIGWNIVTGYLDSAARAMGLNEQLPHDERYERADEYLDILYKLWEGSWEEGAVLRDKVGRVYADPAKVHQVKHAGRYYNVEGYHLSEPSPQRTPVLFQAGSSGRGQQFAARHAECVFISPPNRAVGRETVCTLREQLVQAGRRPDDVKVFTGAAVVTGTTESEAREKYADYLRYASREAGLAHFAASTGIVRSRRAGRLCADERHRIGDAYREAAWLDASQAARNVRTRWPLSGYRRYPRPGRGRTAGMGRGNRRRRLQSKPHRRAGELRGLHRSGGA
jgi:FMN-dependent oxidoreductase (nitrilotriacetate monooxygenase family)